MLVLCMPGAGMERMFTEITKIDAAGRRHVGPPPVDEIAAIVARAGVTLAPPPPAGG